MYIMMKKSTKRILAAAAAVIVFLMLVWGIKYRFGLGPAGEPLLSYIPSYAGDEAPLSLAAGITNPGGVWSDLKRTNFFSALEQKGFYSGDSREKIILGSIGRSAAAAVYASPEGDSFYLLISRLRGPGRVMRGIHRHLSSEYSEIKQHGETGVYQSGDVFYAVSGRVFLASNSMDLIQKSIKLKNGSGPQESFNCVYGWVEGRISRRRSGFIFTSGDNFKYAAAMLLGRESLLVNEDSGTDAYREFYFDRGIKVTSYKPVSRERTPRGRSDALGLITEEAVFAQAFTDIDFAEAGRNLFHRSIIDPALSDEFGKAVSVLGREGAIALTPSRIPSAFPGIVIIAESMPGAYREARDFIERALGVSLRSASSDSFDYEYGRLSLLFTRLDISMGRLKSGRKEFIVIASSRDLFEKTAGVAAGKDKSLKQSSFWKETEKHIPSRYSSVYYADVGMFASAAGPFLGEFLSETGTVSFLAVRPLVWLGPVGGSSVEGREETRSYSYIPVRDLETEQWTDIISAAVVLFNDGN